MKKLFAFSLLSLALSFAAFAGDVAVFEDLGFSKDGKTYIFGQYGKTDVNFQAWAEIFVVDVAENDFVKGEIYKTKPSAATEKLSGKKAFQELLSSSEWKLAKYGAEKCSVENLMYIRENESKSGTDEIVFKDFDASTKEIQIYYHLKLVPTVYGSGLNVSSSYFIELVKQDQNGNVLDKRTVGTPSVKRKGITDYKISKIYSDPSLKSIVMIIEKTLVDKTGTSIRYMVETLTF